jgi:hypothetical protein
MAGYWKAPRVLARMVAVRELTPNEFTLVNLLGESGADRGGLTTTLDYLAGALGVNERTIRRALRSLRARGFITYDDHPGAALFTVRTTAKLAALVSEPVSEPVSEVASDTTPAAEARNPASVQGRQGVRTSDSRARAETETETRELLLQEQQQQFSDESRLDGADDADPLEGSSPAPLPNEVDGYPSEVWE